MLEKSDRRTMQMKCIDVVYGQSKERQFVLFIAHDRKCPRTLQYKVAELLISRNQVINRMKRKTTSMYNLVNQEISAKSTNEKRKNVNLICSKFELAVKFIDCR